MNTNIIITITAVAVMAMLFIIKTVELNKNKTYISKLEAELRKKWVKEAKKTEKANNSSEKPAVKKITKPKSKTKKVVKPAVKKISKVKVGEEVIILKKRKFTKTPSKKTSEIQDLELRMKKFKAEMLKLRGGK